MAAHDNGHVDARQRPVVEVRAREGLRDETSRRRVSRRVVVDHQVVVDGLGDMDALQRIVRGLGLIAQNAERIRRVVAACVEEGSDFVGAQDLQDFLAVFGVRLVARRPERCGWRIADRFEAVARLKGEVDEVLVDDAANAVIRRRRCGPPRGSSPLR